VRDEGLVVVEGHVFQGGWHLVFATVSRRETALGSSHELFRAQSNPYPLLPRTVRDAGGQFPAPAARGPRPPAGGWGMRTVRKVPASMGLRGAGAAMCLQARGAVAPGDAQSVPRRRAGTRCARRGLALQQAPDTMRPRGSNAEARLRSGGDHDDSGRRPMLAFLGDARVLCPRGKRIADAGRLVVPNGRSRFRSPPGMRATCPKWNPRWTKSSTAGFC